MPQKHPKAKAFAFDLHHTGGQLCLARYIEGAVAAETVAAPLDASPSTTYDPKTAMTGARGPYPATPAPPYPIAFNTAGPKTCIVTVACSGGGSVVLRPMVLDQEAAVWLDLAPCGLLSPTLSEGFLWEVTTFERTVLFVVDSVTGTVTDLEILIAPGITYG